MSAYLKFFELEQSPFEGKAQAQVVLGTKALREAFALIRSGLDEGDARICVSGGPGLGKTSLARALPKLLGDNARVAVVLDPEVSWHSLRGSISKQWGLASDGLARSALVEAAQDHRLVLVIDRAERASEEFLDHLDIVLCYRSENDEPVVQSILFARLSSDAQPEPAPIVWWLDRIQTLQLEFAPLPRDGIESYIRKHLKRAGWRGDELFTKEAALAIHAYTGGVPGAVSRLCEQLLTQAAAGERRDIDAAFVHSQCDEDGPDGQSGLEDEAEEPVAEEIETAQDELNEEVFASEQEDETLTMQDDPLSAPASPEELRAILGGVFGRSGRAFAAALIAAMIGGLAIAWWIGKPSGPSEPIAADRSEAARPEPADPTGSGSIADLESPPRVLARLRGPVLTRHPTAPSAPVAPNPIAPNPMRAPEAADSTTLEIADESPENENTENDSIDPQPASMLPYPAGKSQLDERFW